MKLRKAIIILTGGAAVLWTCAAVAEEPADILQTGAVESAEVSGVEAGEDAIEGAEMTGMGDEPTVVVCWTPPPPQHDWTVELWDEIYGIEGHPWGTKILFAGNAYGTQMQFEVVAGGSGAVILLVLIALVSLGSMAKRRGRPQ